MFVYRKFINGFEHFLSYKNDPFHYCILKPKLNVVIICSDNVRLVYLIVQCILNVKVAIINQMK